MKIRVLLITGIAFTAINYSKIFVISHDRKLAVNFPGQR